MLAERFPALPVEIRHHPVILMADCPPKGVRIVDLLKARYGITDLAQAWARPQAEARASRLDLDLGRQPYAYPTLAAHTLIRLAEPKGTQHALAVAITHAYFQQARNINDVDVLADIAVKHGFARDEAQRLAGDPVELARTGQAVADSTARGVTMVPHFVFDERIALVGERSEDEIADAIEQAAAQLMETDHVR